MPRTLDAAARDRELCAATLQVIAEHGVAGVTIRRVAAAMGRSTTAITHHVADRDALLGRAVGAELDRRRAAAEATVDGADDPLWALIEWSVLSDRSGVWPALVAAAAADVEPVVTRLVDAYESWWTALARRLVVGRVAEGTTAGEAAAAIGVVVDGLLLAADASRWTNAHRRKVAHLLVDPLLAP